MFERRQSGESWNYGRRKGWGNDVRTLSMSQCFLRGTANSQKLEYFFFQTCYSSRCNGKGTLHCANSLTYSYSASTKNGWKGVQDDGAGSEVWEHFCSFCFFWATSMQTYKEEKVRIFVHAISDYNIHLSWYWIQFLKYALFSLLFLFKHSSHICLTLCECYFWIFPFQNFELFIVLNPTLSIFFSLFPSPPSAFSASGIVVERTQFQLSKCLHCREWKFYVNRML